MVRSGFLSSRFLALGISSLLIILAPISVLVPTQEAYAASITWDGGGDGVTWGDCDNWSGNNCPSGDDDITIGSGFHVELYGFDLSIGGSIKISSESQLEILDEFVNRGTILNSGTIKIYHDEHIDLDNYGSIINDGIIDNPGDLINRAGGEIQNNSGGTIYNRGQGDIANFGTITNEGTINNDGSLTNSGTIINKCGGKIIGESVIGGNPVINEPCAPSPALCDEPTIIGTDNADFIEGTPGDDIIDGMGGDDIIYGHGGNDIICGGAGYDTIYGGAGNDIIFGGGNDDTIYGEGGNDTIYGGHGRDTISGGQGDDYLNGGAGNDYLAGNGGNDKLFGSSGDDILNGKDGVVNNDSLDGGWGTDTCDSNPDPEVNCEI